MKKILPALALALVAALAPVASADARADDDFVYYDDATGDAKAAIDVVSTQVQFDRPGKFVFVIEGRELTRGDSNFARLFVDTNADNSGPEYQYTWYFDSSPGTRKGAHFFLRVDSWDTGGRRKSCNTGQSIEYGRDLIFVTIPKSCLGGVDQIRWAGALGDITRADSDQVFGYFDYFPAERKFPGGEFVGASAATAS